MRHLLWTVYLALLIAILPTCSGEELPPQEEPIGQVTSAINGASLQGGQVGNQIRYTYFSGTYGQGSIPQCDLSPYSVDFYLNGALFAHQSLNLFGLGDGRCGNTGNYGPISMGTYKIVITHPSLGNNLSLTITPVFSASSISANPTTVQIPYGQSTGSTLVSWNAPGYSSVDVYKSEDGAAQTFMASGGTSGSSNVSSIAAGHQYKFLLYPGGHTTGALAQVTVTGQQLAAPTITANPPTVTIPCGQWLGSTAVSWNAPGYSSVNVYVSVDGATQTLMVSDGSTGSYHTPPWIQPGHSYTFNLYASGNTINPLAQVTVPGQLAAPTINNFAWAPSTVMDGSLSLLTFDIANSDGAGRLACSGAFNFVIDPYPTVNFSHNYPNSTTGLAGQTFTCTLTARQAGCPDASQTRTLTIIAASQTINFDPIADQHLGASPVTISASASSGLPVSFSSSTPGVCMVFGNNVTLITTGTCSITADQSGNNSYNAAASVTRSFTVDPPCPTITNFAWTPSTVADGSLSLLTFDIANSNGAGQLACSGAFNFVIDPYPTVNFSHNYPNSTTGLAGQTFTCTLTARQARCADVTQSRTLTITP